MPRTEVSYGKLGLAKSWPANEETGPLLASNRSKNKHKKNRKTNRKNENNEVSVFHEIVID